MDKHLRTLLVFLPCLAGLAPAAADPLPDPGSDARVQAQLATQTLAVRQFSAAQVHNIGERLRALHDAGPEGYSNRLSLRTELRSRAAEPLRAGLAAPLPAPGTPRVAADDKLLSPPAGLADEPLVEPPFSVWTSGVIGFGNVSPNGQTGDNRFRTSGVTAGADQRVSDSLRAGLSIGYGDDRTDIGAHGERGTASATSAALYAAWRLLPTAFVDALIGYGSGRFATRRWVPDVEDVVSGSRSARLVFASLALVGDLVGDGHALGPFARLEFLKARLHAYGERGHALWVLNYDRASTAATSGVLGLRGEVRPASGWESFMPTWGVEYRHQFDGSDAQRLRYAAAPATRYAALSAVGVQDTVTGSLGLKLSTAQGLTGSVDYTRSLPAGAGPGTHALRATLERRF